MSDLLHRIQSISPLWWGAIAGGVAAGATLVPDQRLIAGAAGGGVLVWLALRMAKPCCASCAGGTPDPGLPQRNEPAMAPDTSDGNHYEHTSGAVDTREVLSKSALGVVGC